MAGLIEKAREFLFRRQYAYKKTFEGPMAQEVLRDLASFCRATRSTAYDPQSSLEVLEGRRQVWLRLQDHLQLPPEALWQLYDGREG